jgi:transposase-like protein
MKSRSYDREFKLNAIELYNNGKSGTNVCRDLGIPDSTFWGWLAEYKQHGANSFVGSGNVKEANKDVHQLQKELDDVKMERDILKKALAIFSRTK